MYIHAYMNRTCIHVHVVHVYYHGQKCARSKPALADRGKTIQSSFWEFPAIIILKVYWEILSTIPL